MEIALRRPVLPRSALFVTMRRIMSRHRLFQIRDGTRTAQSATDLSDHMRRDIGLSTTKIPIAAVVCASNTDPNWRDRSRSSIIQKEI